MLRYSLLIRWVWELLNSLRALADSSFLCSSAW